ncbi:pyridoxamine 5'-phosphate oxidase family protein [Vogesella sp. LIG4]|uniref:pyridoxamine 5'-phosphate oxidase family protein n=1 Tax=Vogesella sp. LIG4 TaxID=1192162 RepID=UPI00081F76A3|nr:pyridoxamine 5'-phosphate oxidase family protein [Vogesella sp. LIG4]SCK27897.1 hypothetical protein PSELUDRAFT_3402 [Vogesella sp. LIG4]
MPRAFARIAFTPRVLAAQEAHGSRQAYRPLLEGTDRDDPNPGSQLGPREAAFIAERSSFYQATVSETGWPYVQHRGGPVGFLRVLDARTLAYTSFAGNRQYISEGNLAGDDRVALILTDYANGRRLKLWGRASLLEAAAAPQLCEAYSDREYSAPVERLILIRVEAFDWNCPKHLPRLYDEAQVRVIIEADRQRRKD